MNGMHEPLVSIIIPTFNRAHLIEETLDSVLAQTYTNWECIVVDDGSTDHTSEVMAAYCTNDSRFQYHSRPDTYLPGGNGARNYGFELSKGEYVNWFDSDDLMMPKKLEKQVAIMESNASLVVNFCLGKKVHFKSGWKRTFRHEFREDLFVQLALNISEIFTPSALLKRDYLLSKNILFDETLYRAQETDFLIRFSQMVDMHQVSYTTKPLFYYVTVEDSISSKDGTYVSKYQTSKAKVFLSIMNIAANRNELRVFEKMYSKTIKILFAALRQRDRENVIYIMTQFNNVLKPQYSFLYWKLKGVVTLNSIFLIPNYKLQSYFMNRNLSFNNKIARPQYD